MSERLLNKPKFIKLKDLKYGRNGYNVIVKVIDIQRKETIKSNGQDIPIINATVGDQTARASAFFKGQDANLIKANQVIAIRNGVRRMFKGHISLQLDIFGRVTEQKTEIKQISQNNISLETFQDNKDGRNRQNRDRRNDNNFNQRRQYNKDNSYIKNYNRNEHKLKRNQQNTNNQSRYYRQYNQREDRDYDNRRGRYYNNRRERDYDNRREKDYDNRRDRDYGERKQRNYNNRNDQEYNRQERNYQNRAKDYQNRDRDFDRRQHKQYNKNQGKHFQQKRDDDYRQKRDDDHRQKRAPLQWVKINEINPGSQGLNLIAKIMKAQFIKEGSFRCILGDDTGIVDAFLTTKHEMKIGSTIALFNVDANVVKQHIQLELGKNGHIDKGRKDIDNVNEKFNLSQKSWIPIH